MKINDHNYHSTYSKEVNSMGKYIIGKENRVEIYDQKTFKKEDELVLDF